MHFLVAALEAIAALLPPAPPSTISKRRDEYAPLASSSGRWLVLAMLITAGTPVLRKHRRRPRTAIDRSRSGRHTRTTRQRKKAPYMPKRTARDQSKLPT